MQIERPIYFDHNATSPADPRTLDAIDATRRQTWGNPQSLHLAGRDAAAIWDQTSSRLCELLGVHSGSPHPTKIFWTTNGTAANHLALNSFISRYTATKRPRIVVSTVEHPSIVEWVRQLDANEVEVDWLGVDADGRIDLDRLSSLLREPASLVAVQWANHETGVIQPIEEITRVCHSADTPLHVDAVQAIGKIDANFDDRQLDSLVFSAHKFGGPRGLAAWIVREPWVPTALRGLGQGTPAVELVAGTVTALEIAAAPATRLRLRRWRDELERSLVEVYPEAIVHGAGVARVCQTLSMAFPPLDRQSLLMALDLAGLCCSAGAACSSGSAEPAPTLVAMGLDRSIIESSIRLSLGPTTTEHDLTAGRRILHRTLIRLRKKRAARSG